MNNGTVIKVHRHQISVKNGKVQQYDRWERVNGKPRLMFKIGRELNRELKKWSGEFFCKMYDNNGECASCRRGTLEEAAANLDSRVVHDFQALFGLKKADDVSIKGIGFRGFQIKRIA